MLRRVGATAVSAAATFSFCVGQRAYATTEAAAAAAAAAAGSGTDVGVVTYNILSPALAGEDHYYNACPTNLHGPTRLARVKAKLEGAIAEGRIICLQEVSLQWSGPLHVYFAKRGYHLVLAPYGSAFSDHMGVAVAWDASRYQAEDIEIVKVASTYSEWPKKEKKAEPGLLEKLLNFVLQRKVEKPYNPWNESQWRKNQLILARLAPREEGKKPFVVACYHMPCLFGSAAKVQGMNIHAQLTAKHVQKFAGDTPYLMVGDWNSLPNSTTYQLLTKGSLEAEHNETPVHPDGTWTPSIEKPMRSGMHGRDRRRERETSPPCCPSQGHKKTHLHTQPTPSTADPSRFSRTTQRRRGAASSRVRWTTSSCLMDGRYGLRLLTRGEK